MRHIYWASALFFCAAIWPSPVGAASTLPPSPTVTATATATSTSLPTATPVPNATTTAVKLLLARINATRAQHHRSALTLDTRQSRCSSAHSRHMAKIGYIAHDQFPQDVCTPHSWVGENVGVADGEASAAVLMLESMMIAEGPCPHHGCPGAEWERHGHYLNLLDSHFTRLGIGIYLRGANVWLTEDFTGPPETRHS